MLENRRSEHPLEDAPHSFSALLTGSRPPLRQDPVLPRSVPAPDHSGPRPAVPYGVVVPRYAPSEDGNQRAHTDPLGSWTGLAADPTEEPVQDADDL